MPYKWIPVIDAERCTGCGLCVDACGPQCLEMIGGLPILTKLDLCGSEEHCIPPCRHEAIYMDWVKSEGDQKVGRWKP